MVKGFDNIRRGLEVKMHKVVNDAARDVVDRINKHEPKFQAKARQGTSTPESAEVFVTGSAELAPEKRESIKDMLDDTIEDAIGS